MLDVSEEKTYDDGRCGSESKYGLARQRGNSIILHLDPPANTQAADKIGYEDAQDTIDGPVVSDSHMTQVMSSKDQLMPHQAKEDGACHEPVLGVGEGRETAKEDVTYELWPIT